MRIHDFHALRVSKDNGGPFKHRQRDADPLRRRSQHSRSSTHTLRRHPQQKKPFYNGRSASRTYDKLFKSSHRIPGLASYIPQGTATWSNWQGQDDLILITSYDKAGRKSIISGVDAKTGEHVGYAQIAYSHDATMAIWATDRERGRCRPKLRD